MCSALYHGEKAWEVAVSRMTAHPHIGKRVHWLWDYHGSLISRWRKLGTSEWKESRVVGFVGDYGLGSFAGIRARTFRLTLLSCRVL